MAGRTFNSTGFFAADEARKSIAVYEERHDEQSAQLGRDKLAVIEAAVVWARHQ